MRVIVKALFPVFKFDNMLLLAQNKEQLWISLNHFCPF